MYKLKIEMPHDHHPGKTEFPHWFSGLKENNHIYLVYSDDLDKTAVQWPGGIIDIVEKTDHIIFTSRFPKPVWFLPCEVDYNAFYQVYKGHELQNSLVFKDGIAVAYCHKSTPYAYSTAVRLINEGKL